MIKTNLTHFRVKQKEESGKPFDCVRGNAWVRFVKRVLKHLSYGIILTNGVKVDSFRHVRVLAA